MKDSKSVQDSGPKHKNYNVKGLVLSWKDSDSQWEFEKNCKDPAKQKLLEQLGWLEPNCISYKFNSFGFRDEEFDSRPCGIALGCSFTEGTGLPEHTVWPRVLSKMTGTHTWNLGVGGSSIDTTFRLLDYWLTKLSPKFVTLCTPPDGRVEVFDRDEPLTLMPGINSILEPFNAFFKVWASSDTNAMISKQKNLLAMQQLCNQANIPLVYLDYTSMITHGDARDLAHFGVNSHANFAEQIYNLLPKDVL
jgi:hypothetical protein